MSTYATQAQVESIFGTDNIATWLDMDNDGSEDTGRMTRSIAVASEMIDDVIRCTAYVVPLANASAAISPTISDLAATLAGLWLYESRGSQDFHPQTGVPNHRLAWKRTYADQTLELIRTGARKIDAL